MGTFLKIKMVKESELNESDDDSDDDERNDEEADICDLVIFSVVFNRKKVSIAISVYRVHISEKSTRALR
jgi:hypothetical protein